MSKTNKDCLQPENSRLDGNCSIIYSTLTAFCLLAVIVTSPLPDGGSRPRKIKLRKRRKATKSNDLSKNEIIPAALQDELDMHIASLRSRFPKMGY